MTGHSYLGNIDQAFPWNSLCNRILSDSNFLKNYFLITQASPYHYQQIPGNPVVKIFHNQISWRISSCINMCDRILTYGTLLDVLWLMYHTWITYGMVRRIA